MQDLTQKKYLNTLYPLITTAESQKLILNFSMSITSFYNTVQSLWIRSQEILTSAIYLPKLKSTYKKAFEVEVSNLKYKAGR